MSRLLTGFVAGLIAMAGGGYLWLHHGQDARVTESRNILTGTRTTTIEVGEAVSEIRTLDRLVVFQAYLIAVTDAKECRFWGCPIESTQTLLSPAFVNYYIDMDRITDASLTLRGDRLHVRIPPLMIERPNIDTAQQRVFNAGLWSRITGADRRLEALTRPLAVRQLYGRANMPFLLRAARRQAVAAVFANVRKTLNASGHQDVLLSVSF